MTERWAVTRLHNAMVLIEVADAVVLTDPWFSSNFAFRGSSPIRPSDLPEITAVIGSHWAGDHWRPKDLRSHVDPAVPMYVSDPSMCRSAERAGFDNVEVLAWGDNRSLTDFVRLEAYEEHAMWGKKTSNYGIIGPDVAVFFGGEVLDLSAIRRGTPTQFDVAIGPVNGVRLLGKPLTATAEEMLEATRIVGASTMIPIHDEHKSFWPLQTITSSARSLDGLGQSEVAVRELAFGERYPAHLQQ